MKSKINFITLAVNNLQKSKRFYSEAFNFKISQEDNDLCLFSLEDNFHIALQQKEDFTEQSGLPVASVLSSGFILSINVDSSDEVELNFKRMEKLGCNRTKTLDESWGYSVLFTDINGHGWEIVYMK